MVDVMEEGLPPGFRFHPTDEEIITHYLAPKATNNRFSARAIGDVDLNKCEPWDLPSKARMGEEEWFFFYQKDRKYQTGTRTNRATEAGYWKATGKDKEIYRGRGVLVGMKKTLVFYRGRAPKGQKTSWVMHEYRLQGSDAPQSVEDEWVVCRVFHKNMGRRSPTPPPPQPPPPGIQRVNTLDPPRMNFQEHPPIFSATMGTENRQAVDHRTSSNPPDNSYRLLPEPANSGYLHHQDAAQISPASSAIRRHCKMDGCWDTDLSWVMSKDYGDLHDPSSSAAGADLESIRWF